MLKVNIMLYMNHVIQDIDTPPRLLPGGGHSGLSELLDCTRARKTDFKFVMCEHKFLMSLGVCCNNLLEFLKLSEYRRRN